MSNPISQQEAIQAFITLANDMKSNGSSIQFVSTAFMGASRSIHPRRHWNDGGLHASGIDKLKELFASELQEVQSARLRDAGLSEPPSSS